MTWRTKQTTVNESITQSSSPKPSFVLHEPGNAQQNTTVTTLAASIQDSDTHYSTTRPRCHLSRTRTTTTTQALPQAFSVNCRQRAAWHKKTKDELSKLSDIDRPKHPVQSRTTELLHLLLVFLLPSQIIICPLLVLFFQYDHAKKNQQPKPRASAWIEKLFVLWLLCTHITTTINNTRRERRHTTTTSKHTRYTENVFNNTNINTNTTTTTEWWCWYHDEQCHRWQWQQQQQQQQSHRNNENKTEKKEESLIKEHYRQ